MKTAFVSGLMILALGFALLHNSKYLTCQVNYRDDIDIEVGNSIIKTEVVKTPEALAKGLGGRACMNSNQGMLFVFQHPGHYPFWMKDMEFPIDMIWLSDAKQVVYIQSNVAPSTYPQNFINNVPAQYVLELKASEAQYLKLHLGTQLQF